MEVDGLGGSNDEPHLPSFRFDEDEDSDGELNRYACTCTSTFKDFWLCVWGEGYISHN